LSQATNWVRRLDGGVWRRLVDGLVDEQPLGTEEIPEQHQGREAENQKGQLAIRQRVFAHDDALRAR
jgi:hypothetical protein